MIEINLTKEELSTLIFHNNSQLAAHKNYLLTNPDNAYGKFLERRVAELEPIIKKLEGSIIAITDRR